MPRVREIGCTGESNEHQRRHDGDLGVAEPAWLGRCSEAGFIERRSRTRVGSAHDRGHTGNSVGTLPSTMRNLCSPVCQADVRDLQ